MLRLATPALLIGLPDRGATDTPHYAEAHYQVRTVTSDEIKGRILAIVGQSAAAAANAKR